jgi:hypothetical protein
VNKLLSIFAGKHQPNRGALSAYLDGELELVRASQVEAHVMTCAACAAVLEGMREVQAVLRELPAAETPRSFRLRPADVEAPRRGVPAPPAPLMRLMPALSAAAVIVFAVTVGLDVARGGARSDDSANQPGALSAQAPESPSEYSASELPAAPDATSAAARSVDSAEGVNETPPAPAPNAMAPSNDAGADSQSGAGEAAEGDGAATQPTDQSRMDVEATSADADDDGGNNLALRIVEVASASVAIVAAGVALRMWRKRGEAAV